MLFRIFSNYFFLMTLSKAYGYNYCKNNLVVNLTYVETFPYETARGHSNATNSFISQDVRLEYVRLGAG